MACHALGEVGALHGSAAATAKHAIAKNIVGASGLRAARSRQRRQRQTLL